MDEYDKSLRAGLQMLLYAEPAGILRAWLNQTRTPYYQTVPNSFSQRLPKAYPEQFSGDDAKRVAAILQQQYDKPGKFGVFSLISDFAVQTLDQRDFRPLVRYEQILRWRHTVHPLGTIPFVCAFLARKDLEIRFFRQDFCLDPILRTDNRRLRAMLAQGMAENHFHLKGSARTCLLSWVSLMNDSSKRQKAFRHMEQLQLRESTETLGRPLYVLVLQAAAIRAFLFTKLQGLELDLSELLSKVLQAETELDITVLVAELNSCLNSLQVTFGAQIRDSYPDYAIQQPDRQAEESPFLLLSGEYWFQYQMFRAIYQRKPDIQPYLDLFYAYLVINILFREELIQCNQMSGFQNFNDYDSRKGNFLKGRPPFEQDYESGAAAMVLQDERIRSLEIRIVPKTDVGQLANQIRRIDTFLQDKVPNRKDRMYYVLHIPKQADIKHDGSEEEYIRCRDQQLRRTAGMVAETVIRLRERGIPEACRIRGIDACANEIDARPEAFAVPYRRLKNHHPSHLPLSGDAVPSLNVTYHVGEDFLDLTDGLRAMWEAVEFLELGRSDRIGHGLALGVNPEEWYKAKQYRVYLTRQALLDNCAWMLYQLERHGNLDAQLARELNEECTIHYAAVYQSNQPWPEPDIGFDSTNYYHAMLLRGDVPDCYQSYQNAGQYERGLEFALIQDPYSLRNDYPGQICHTVRRRNRQAIRLYHHYHFNPRVKQCGDEVVEYRVSKRYVQAVVQLQKMMQNLIARRGIGIETNPSSNVLIGSFKRYDRHPLIMFHDRGLFDCPGNPNLFVSINTDDQGIFDTCLENEYALMARSLEQLTDDGDLPVVSGDRIYSWLDHIRQMGLEQSFLYGDAISSGQYP